MKTRTTIVTAALACLALAGAAQGQSNQLYNGGFEEEDTFFGGPVGWKDFTNPGERYRRIGDGLGPILVRTGDASIELASGNNFAGFTSDQFVDCLGRNNNPPLVFDTSGGVLSGPDVTVTGWYAIPADQPLTDANSGLKLEFRRANNSVFHPFESLTINGHTNGQWVEFSMTVTTAQLDELYAQYPPGPVSVSVLPIRFGMSSSTGTIFWDDITLRQGCAADIDKNGFVNGDDFDAFVAAFELGDTFAEYDNNCFLNGDDFDAFVADFLAGC